MIRFTIRDVLWLTVVVALAVGWSLDHWKPVHRMSERLRARREAQWRDDIDRKEEMQRAPDSN
jgi:hypothetical protein